MDSKNINNYIHSILKFIRYNLKIIFAYRFLYFLIAAIILFLLITIINLFDANATFDSEAIYWLLLMPGLLLVFYPTNFIIQNDVDVRMLETIFGIPNYRYKVYFFRLFFTLGMTMLILFFLAIISSVALTTFSIATMIFQLSFPLFFVGSLAFMFSTITRNGNATAVIIVIIGLMFFFAAEALYGSRWNLFHNPFSVPAQVNAFIWAKTTFYNRLYMLVGSILAMLMGLRNLQKREWFV